jgi:glycosyltransferase involved in cell wall biosynthesis
MNDSTGIKVCHVNLTRGYRGGERQTELLVRELHARSVPQRVIVRKGEELARRLSDIDGLDLHCIRRPHLASIGLARGWLVHAHEAKAVHFAHWAHWAHGAPYLLTRRINRPPSDRWMTRRAYRKADAVVAVAAAVAEGLRAYEPTLSPTVIHSAMSMLPVSSVRAGQIRGRWPGKFLVGHAGALDNSQKGQSYLIQAARRLARELPQLHFVLLGSGPDEARFRQEAAGLDNITFEGFVKNVGDYMSVFDLFVLPSLHEGIGGILLDAMSFGVPVVASNVDGLPEIVQNDHNGFLVPPADEAGLVRAIRRLYNDASLRARFGAEGRKVAVAHQPEAMADQYLSIYADMTSTR